MPIVITTKSMEALTIVPRITEDWNTALTSGRAWRDTVTTINSPIFGELFVGTVEYVSEFVYIQVVKTQAGTLRTFRRVSHEVSSVLTWNAWTEQLIQTPLTAGTNITIVDNVINSQGGEIYTPMVLGGFNDDIITVDDLYKIPKFMTLSDGRIMLTRINS